MRSLYWKITIPFVVLILIGMGFLGFHLTNSFRDAQLAALRSELVKEADLVAEVSRPGFTDPAAQARLDTTAKTVGRAIDIRITLIAPDGTVLGDTDEDPATLENHSGRPEVIAALASGLGESTRYSTTLRETMMYVAVPVVNQKTVSGIARVALPLSTVESAVNSARITVASSVLLAWLLTIFATALMIRKMTRPLREITGAARKLASGELGGQIPVRTGDEIGQLARAFNRMSLQLRDILARVSEERTRLAAVLATMSDGVIMTDVEGNLLLANSAAERDFGFTAAGAEGKPLIEAVHDHEVDAVLKNCLETSGEQSAQIDTAAGRFLRVVGVPFTSGKQRGALLLFQDLTELRTLQTTRREFVGNISHELRTPLAAIKAMVETLKDGAIDDKQAAPDFLARIDAEVDGMTQMVNELIELSRMETGKVKLKLEPVDLGGLVQETVSRLGPQAERQKVTLSTALEPDLPPVHADREKMRQVLMNLVHNAIKFTPAGGRIAVSTRHDKEHVLVEVSDTGIGISRQDLPHIFERFFKADRSRSSGGTGLGLAIARHTVQVHGGTIWVRSEEGKGSVFGFSLPR